ncbi:BON domain-containing protein [Nesterenkonia natronophila]|uniref:BON domain-containing protein n=1 Tax=Nesterenkonia natronophila TaxID=2174932 RepID=A0A3A4F388_9MICC|nr:BON domain-containing protein [Nesterenkonia natronophila]RJN32523.1 BON domain-containing protein [Nesterenkonia natronophila]
MFNSPTPTTSQRITDGDFTEIVNRTLRRSPMVPNAVMAHISGRHVTLTGAVDSYLQRDAAEEAIRRLDDVESVDNRITLIIRSPIKNAEQHIRHAMLRNPMLDSSAIRITIIGHTAILTGHVGSLAEKKQAGLATWASSIVRSLDNRLKIQAH